MNRLDSPTADYNINTRQQTMAIWWLLIANNTGHMTRTNQWETRRMTRTTNQNMTQWTREPIAWINEGKGSMKQTETMTKLQNKRHEHKTKPHFTNKHILKCTTLLLSNNNNYYYCCCCCCCYYLIIINIYLTLERFPQPLAGSQKKLHDFFPRTWCMMGYA